MNWKSISIKIALSLFLGALAAVVYYSNIDTTTEWYDRQVALRDSVHVFVWIGGILLCVTLITDVWKLLLTCIASLSLAVRGKYPDDQKQ